MACHKTDQTLLTKVQKITIMITHIVHQAQDVQQCLKITVLIEIDLNRIAVLNHRKEINGLTIMALQVNIMTSYEPCGTEYTVQLFLTIYYGTIGTMIRILCIHYYI